MTVKELFWHKTIEMTLRYAHLSPNHKMFAVEKMTKIFEQTYPLPHPLEGGEKQVNENDCNIKRALSSVG